MKAKILSNLFGGFLVLAMCGVVFTAWKENKKFEVNGSGIGTGSYVVQSVADTINNSTTFKNSAMVFQLAANQSVHVRYSLPFRLSGATSGIKFSITCPTGFLNYSSAGVLYSVADSVISVNVLGAPGSQGATIGATGSSIMNIDLDIINGPNAGPVTLQYAQNAAQVANTILLRGAYGAVWKR